MNRLERSLLNDNELDFYLENVSREDFKSDVEEIKKKSMLLTDAGRLKKQLLEILNKDAVDMAGYAQCLGKIDKV